MFRFLRKSTFSLCLTLAAFHAADVIVLTDEAVAADEKRRVLKARQMESSNLNAELARQAEQKTLEAIKFLKEILGGENPPTGPRKAEMMLRLADLYFEQGRSIYLREMAAYEKVFDKCFNTDGCDFETMEPDNKESNKWQNNSIRLYEQILRNYPRYSRADEATFYLGMALFDLGRQDDAVKQFTKLVKQYPDSAMVPDAFVNIGEYYFENNNAYKALLAYKKATAYRESPKYSFALYKLAWCYYNVGEYGKAIEKMKSVVAYTQTETGQDKRMDLQGEALKDLVQFFADAGEMEEAYEYFNKLGKKELIRSMLKRLASMYFDQGKFEQCIQTYRRLISENPQSEDNPGYQTDIIKAYKKIGKQEETLQEIDRLLKTYGSNSSWARSNASNQDAVKEANSSIEKNLRTVAVEYHQRAKKLGRGDEAKRTYALAYKAYKVYLTEFPQSSHAYEVRYAFGELLYGVKKYAEAYDQYMAVVKIDAKGKHTKFCARSAMFAAKAMIDKEGKSNTKKSQGSVGKQEAQELTDWEKKYVAACRQFSELFPEDKKVQNIIYSIAYLLYNKHRFDEAAEQFRVVIKMNPQSREAEDGAHLILDAFVVNDDTANLRKNAKFFYEQERLGSKAFKKEVYEIYQKASFKLIEKTFEKNKDKKVAGDAFVAFYKEFKTTAKLETLSKALQNATVYYRDTEAISESMKIRHLLVEDPQFGAKTKYYYRQIAALGYDYETIASLDKAAFYYEKMFSLYPNELKKLKKSKDEDKDTKIANMESQAADAIYSAAVFRKALEDSKAAINNYQKLVTAFPNDSRIDDVKITIARIHEENEDWTPAANAFMAFYTQASKETSPDFTFLARLRHGKALEKMNQKSKADRVYKETVELYGKLVEAGAKPSLYTDYAAEMMFILAQPQLEEFMELGIKSLGKGAKRKAEDKHLIAQLKDKQQSLKGIGETYVPIIETGSGQWSLAALVQLGKAMEDHADTLENGDIPFYLTGDQAELYQMSMQDQVYPKIEEAVNFYKQALDKAYELTLYTEDTAFATRRLGVLRPDDFPRLEEEIIQPRFTSSKSRSYDFEKEMK